MKPLGPRILVKPLQTEENEVRSEGGIILEGVSEADTHLKGEVISVSDDIGTRLKPGDIVLYEKNAGTLLKEGLLMDYRSVAAIV